MAALFLLLLLFLPELHQLWLFFRSELFSYLDGVIAEGYDILGSVLAPVLVRSPGKRNDTIRT
jgi:hypothetical protein